MKNRLGMWLLFSIVAGISLDMVASAGRTRLVRGGYTPSAPAAAAAAAAAPEAQKDSYEASGIPGQGAITTPFQPDYSTGSDVNKEDLQNQDEGKKTLSAKEVIANKINEYKDRLGKFRDAAVKKLNEHREKFVKFGSETATKLKNLFTKRSSDVSPAPAAAAAATTTDYDPSIAPVKTDYVPYAASEENQPEVKKTSFTERAKSTWKRIKNIFNRDRYEANDRPAAAAVAEADAPHAE